MHSIGGNHKYCYHYKIMMGIFIKHPNKARNLLAFDIIYQHQLKLSYETKK